MRLSSRIGVWGMVAGLGATFAATLGVYLPFGMSGLVSGLGFFAGGLGVSVASAIVLRQTRGSFRILKAGALVGIPFGVLAALRGVLLLWLTPWVRDNLILLSLTSLGLLGLGIILIVLFLAGVLKHAWAQQDSDPEFT